MFSFREAVVGTYQRSQVPWTLLPIRKRRLQRYCYQRVFFLVWHIVWRNWTCDSKESKYLKLEFGILPTEPLRPMQWWEIVSFVLNHLMWNLKITQYLATSVFRKTKSDFRASLRARCSLICSQALKFCKLWASQALAQADSCFLIFLKLNNLCSDYVKLPQLGIFHSLA